MSLKDGKVVNYQYHVIKGVKKTKKRGKRRRKEKRCSWRGLVHWLHCTEDIHLVTGEKHTGYHHYCDTGQQGDHQTAHCQGLAGTGDGPHLADHPRPRVLVPAQHRRTALSRASQLLRSPEAPVKSHLSESNLSQNNTKHCQRHNGPRV